VADQTRELQLGETIGPYRIEAELGVGGMGRVYQALDGDGKRVALKVVKSELAGDVVFRRRFEREASAARKVDDPHVVAVLDSGDLDGIPFIAQEFMSGGTLADRIDGPEPLELETIVDVVLQVAKGLDSLHAVGIIHRDVKPENILFDEAGQAHITDFGLAKDRAATVLTKPGQALGSMDYMAPEQIRATDVGPATDVYALGCVVFECIAGKPPFADRDGMQVLWAHLQDPPNDPCAARDDIPDELGWAILRALEKEPDKRPPTATGCARMVQMAAGQSSPSESAETQPRGADG
jgi:serine/threonine protein kinase